MLEGFLGGIIGGVIMLVIIYGIKSQMRRL